MNRNVLTFSYIALGSKYYRFLVLVSVTTQISFFFKSGMGTLNHDNFRQLVKYLSFSSGYVPLYLITITSVCLQSGLLIFIFPGKEVVSKLELLGLSQEQWKSPLTSPSIFGPSYLNASALQVSPCDAENGCNCAASKMKYIWQYENAAKPSSRRCINHDSGGWRCS